MENPTASWDLLHDRFYRYDALTLMSHARAAGWLASVQCVLPAVGASSDPLPICF